MAMDPNPHSRNPFRMRASPPTSKRAAMIKINTMEKFFMECLKRVLVRLLVSDMSDQSNKNSGVEWSVVFSLSREGL